MTAPASLAPVHSALPLLALAGLASMAAMRVGDAMLPAIGASFGVTATAASGVVSAFAIGYGVMQLAFGWLGDRYARPRVIAVALLVCGVAAIASAAAPTLGLLLAARTLMGAAAGGIIPLTMAWIGDEVAWQERQLVLARLLTWTVSGLIVGAWGGGALADTLGWRWAFAVLACLFLAPALMLLWRHGSTPPASMAGAPTGYLQRLSTLLGSRWARELYAITMVEGALVFGVLAFAPTLLHERLGLPMSAAGGVVALFGLGGIVYSRTARLLLARMTQARLALAGAVLLCICCLTLAWMRHWGAAALACTGAGLGYYMLHNTLQTCATQLSSTARGTAMTLFACALFLGQSVGVLVAAACMHRGWSAGFYAGAGVGLLALGWVFAVAMRARRSSGAAAG